MTNLSYSPGLHRLAVLTACVALVQDVVRTSHVLCGMLLFVTTVVLTVRIARLLWLSLEIRWTSSNTTA